MDKCTQLLQFLQALFDDPAVAQKSPLIVGGIMKTHSPRLIEFVRERFYMLSSKLHKTGRKGADQKE